jgi:hypothetical protein
LGAGGVGRQGIIVLTYTPAGGINPFPNLAMMGF